MSNAMELTPESLDRIGEYVKDHLGLWLKEVAPLQFGAGGAEDLRREIDVRERIVRVEEELKAQREVMQQGFAMMERRFEAVDQRFEAVDKRFEEQMAHTNARFETVDKRFSDLNRHMTLWMTVLSVLIGLLAVSPLLERFL
jgi:hypothetical protein